MIRDPWSEIEAAAAARDAGVAAALDHDRDGWDRKTVDQAVAEFARRGRPFSAADLREILPAVAGSVVGARLLAASRSGLIEPCGDDWTRHPESHRRRIRLWRGRVPVQQPLPDTDVSPEPEPGSLTCAAAGTLTHLGHRPSAAGLRAQTLAVLDSRPSSDPSWRRQLLACIQAEVDHARGGAA